MRRRLVAALAAVLVNRLDELARTCRSELAEPVLQRIEEPA